MSSRKSNGNYKRFSYFTEKSDFEAPLKFMCELPPVPIEPKLLNFSIPLERAIKYNPTCLEINREQTLFADLAGGINVDLINPKVYEKHLNQEEINQLPPEDLELSELVLSADATKVVKSNPQLNLARSNSTADIMSKLNLKSDKEKSRYKNLDKDEVSMYLRHTTILTAGNSKVYGQTFDDPVATVKNYQGDEFFESGEELNTEQFNRLLKLIDKSFTKINDVHVGMQKPGGRNGVTAKSVKSVYPCYELLNKPAYLCQYYDNPLKGVINEEEPNQKVNLNNESVLVKHPQEESYKLYGVQSPSRGLLGKRKREETDEGTFIKRKVAKYDKKGVYRYTETDENIFQSAYLFYDIGNDQLSYLPINKRLMLVRKKEGEQKKKLVVPGFANLDDEEDDEAAEQEYKTRFFRLSERSYKESEVNRKLKNIKKLEVPIIMDPNIETQEELKNKDIEEVYSEPPIEEEEEERRLKESGKGEGDEENLDELFGDNDDDDQNVSYYLY